MKKYLRLLPSIIVITTLATTAFSAQAATVAYYNMDELSGDIADSSGNNLDAGFRSVGTGFAYNQPSVPVGTYGALTVDASTAAFFGGSFKGGDDTINRRNFDAGAPESKQHLIDDGCDLDD